MTKYCTIHEVDELKSAKPIASTKGFGILTKDEVHKLSRSCRIKRDTLEYLLGRHISKDLSEFYMDRELFNSLVEISGVKPHFTMINGGKHESKSKRKSD